MIPKGYGIEPALGLIMWKGDFGCSEVKPMKKVILTNPKDFVKKGLSFMDVVSAWCDTGHAEWEAMLAAVFIADVDAAIKANTEADITNLFMRDFYASGGRVLTQRQIFDHIIKNFEIQAETPDALYVRM